MTWVIGTSSFLGYGVMIADVQVTFPNGTTRDCLRKIYPIANHVVAGFSGSVHIGFALLQGLSEFLDLPPDVESTHAWDPRWIANNWPERARDIFHKQPLQERKRKTSLLLVAISPDEDRGAPGFQKVYILRFASPTFTPGVVTRPFQAISIGSGASESYYKNSVKQLCRMSSGSHQAEVGKLFGWADLLCFNLSRMAIEKPRKGISQHFHLIAFNQHNSLERNSDHKTHGPDDAFQIEHIMPAVASNYQEFRSMCSAGNLDAALAAC